MLRSAKENAEIVEMDSRASVSVNVEPTQPTGSDIRNVNDSESDSSGEDFVIGCNEEANSVASVEHSEQVNVEATNSDDGLTEWQPVNTKKNGVLNLEPSAVIRYKSSELTQDMWEEATVLGPGGTVRGQNKNLFNIIKSSDQSKHHIHLDKCSVEKKNVESTNSVMYIEEEYIPAGIFAVHVPKGQWNDPRIQEAMEAELSSWKKYGVYREIPDTGQSTISTRWVVTPKANGYKARLVVRGFEEQLTQHVDSPTGDKCSSRIMMSLAKANNWSVESMDIKAAFLQSQSLDRTVYVKPPANLKKVGLIWQLEKPAYGLNDSPRNWYNSLKEFLLCIGCLVCRFDPGFFYYKNNNKLIGLILLHVDDFMICGNRKFNEDICKKIMQKYDISKHLKGTFKYIGITISQDEEFITMDQFEYAKCVKIVDLDKGRRMQKDSLLSANEKTYYLSLLGKLSWLSYITRPDLKWDVYNLARCNKNPTVKDLLDLNKVVSKLNVGKRIRFPKLDLKNGQLKIIVHCDASFGNLDNKVNSSRGYIIFLCSGDKACCLTWATNKIKRVVSSTLESETLACVDGLNHAEWLRGIVSELLYGRESDEKIISIIGFTDSNQLYQSIHSTSYVSNHKLRGDVEIIKEKLT